MKKICIILMTKNKKTINIYKKRFLKSFKKNVKIYFKYYYDNSIINFIKNNNINGIILTGSEDRILDNKNNATLPKKILQLNIPILAICYGFQWIIKTICGNKSIRTFKSINNKIHTYKKILSFKLPFVLNNIKYHFNHHDYIIKIPIKWKKIITHKKQIWMAYDKYKKIIGIQFHPEKLNKSRKIFFDNWLKYIDK